MTDPKSRVRLALELADLLPAKPGDPTTEHWGGVESDQVGTELLKGGITAVSIALANVLLHLVDERETQLHPPPPGWYMCEACELQGATSNLLVNGEPWARVCQPCSLDEGVAKGRIRDRRAKTAAAPPPASDQAEWERIVGEQGSEIGRLKTENARLSSDYAELQAFHDGMLNRLTRNPSDAKKEHDAAVATIEHCMTELAAKADAGDAAVATLAEADSRLVELVRRGDEFERIATEQRARIAELEGQLAAVSCCTAADHAQLVKADKRKAGDERAASAPELVRQCENCGGRAFALSYQAPLGDAECENCGYIESADVAMPAAPSDASVVSVHVNTETRETNDG